MNLILCNENCKHQKDGYCALEAPGTVHMSSSNCCYFECENIKTPDDNPPEVLDII